jgi:hypothetical protein
VKVRTDLSVETLCEAVFEWGTVSWDHENLKHRKLLEDHGDVRVVYDQLQPPVVSGRDYAFTVRRVREGDDCKLDFTSTNDKAPPSPDGWVRLARLKATWRFTRTPGGTDIVYTLYADPGGSLPARLVHSSQREAAINSVKKGVTLSRMRPRASAH